MTADEKTLYDQVMRRLDEASRRLDTLLLAPTVRAVVDERLAALRRYARFDLTHVSREVEAVHADLDAGVVPLYDDEGARP
jgi:hypothetical protein